MWLPLTTRDIGSVGAPTVKTTGAPGGPSKSWAARLGRLGAGLAADLVGCRRARRSGRGDHATALAAAPRRRPARARAPASAHRVGLGDRLGIRALHARRRDA